MTRLVNYGRFGLWWLGLAYIAASLTGYANALPPQVQLAGLLAALASLLNLLLIARAHRQAKEQPDPSPFFKGRRPLRNGDGSGFSLACLCARAINKRFSSDASAASRPASCTCGGNAFA